MERALYFLFDVFHTIHSEEGKEVSLGVFRISKDYLKNMRRQRKGSILTLYPYETEKGVYHYGSLSSEMITYVKGFHYEMDTSRKNI